MSKKTTVGRLLLEKAIPGEFKSSLLKMENATKGDLRSFFQHVADTKPEAYKGVLQQLKDLGDDIATTEGSSFSLLDFTPPFNKKEVLKPLLSKINKIRSSSKPLEEQEAEVGNLLQGASGKIRGLTLESALKRGDVISQMVATGTRGKPAQLNMMVGSPLMFTDHHNRPITVPVISSYSEGLKPYEYWTASYGARKGVISEKLSLRDAGYMGKQLVRVANTLLVTADDCGVQNGIMESTSGSDAVGRYLARSEGGYPRNTLVTAEVLSGLVKRGVKSVMVRSPLTCEATNGICKYCSGQNEKSKLPELGENVGINAAHSMSEPLMQMTLNVKHSGGVAGGGGVGGFKLLKQLTTIPKNFTHGSILSEKAGTVEKVVEAPQGGHYITVGEQKHYSPPLLTVIKKVGDSVEQGDQLTDGIVNPSDVTRLKGVGAGRLYWARAMEKVMRDNGVKLWKPNYEIIAKGLVNHVRVEDPEGLGDSLPDDVIEYSANANSLIPQSALVTNNVRQTLGQYLGQNVLHYTIGTKITPSVMRDIQRAKIQDVKVTNTPPSVTPVMLRSADVPQAKKDWQAQLGATNLKRNLLKAISRGMISKRHGLHPEPALAYGLEFGKPVAGKIGY